MLSVSPPDDSSKSVDQRLTVCSRCGRADNDLQALPDPWAQYSGCAGCRRDLADRFGCWLCDDGRYPDALYEADDDFYKLTGLNDPALVAHYEPPIDPTHVTRTFGDLGLPARVYDLFNLIGPGDEHRRWCLKHAIDLLANAAFCHPRGHPAREVRLGSAQYREHRERLGAHMHGVHDTPWRLEREGRSGEILPHGQGQREPLDTPEEARRRLMAFVLPPSSILSAGGAEYVPPSREEVERARERVLAAEDRARAAKEPQSEGESAAPLPPYRPPSDPAERDAYIYNRATDIGYGGRLSGWQLNNWQTFENLIGDARRARNEREHLPGCHRAPETKLGFSWPPALTDRFCPACLARARRDALAAAAEQRQATGQRSEKSESDTGGETGAENGSASQRSLTPPLFPGDCLYCGYIMDAVKKWAQEPGALGKSKTVGDLEHVTWPSIAGSMLTSESALRDRRREHREQTGHVIPSPRQILKHLSLI